MKKKHKTSKVLFTEAAAAITVIVLTITALSCSAPENSYTSKSADATLQKLKPQARRIIEQSLKDENPSIKTKAIEVVADTGQTDLMPLITDLVNNPYIPVKFASAVASGDLQYRPARNQLESLLQSRNKNLRIAAAYALYKLGDEEKLNLILEAIKDQNQTARANATFLLGKTGSKKCLQSLYWAMRNKNSSYKVSLQAAQAIARLGDEKIYSKLWTMLISTYADDRLMGIRAMGALGSARAKNALINMLNDNVLEVRLEAAAQLGRLKDKMGTPEVIEVFAKDLLNERDRQSQQRIKVLTALAIGQIGDPKVINYLPQLINDQSKIVRIAASKAVLLCFSKTQVR